MLELLREREDLWSCLERADRPIYLYGMGDGAEKILAVLARHGIPVAGIFASDEFVRGHSFRGYPVQRFSEVKAQHGADFIALLSFAVDYEPMLSRLYLMGEECEFYAPDVPVVWSGEEQEVFDLAFLRKHEKQFDCAYALLVDEQSRAVFRGTIDFKLSGRVEYLRGITTEASEAWSLLNLSDEEEYVDLGAYNGDTVLDFLGNVRSYRSITALEPDEKNFEKLRRMAEEHGLVQFDARNVGAWDCADTLYVKKGRKGRGSTLSHGEGKPVAVDTLDNVLNGRQASIIKFDVEGAEWRAIQGAAETIRRCQPRLILSAYHRNEDLFALPLVVKTLRPDAKFYLRRHPYIPAWETNYYIV